MNIFEVVLGKIGQVIAGFFNWITHQSQRFDFVALETAILLIVGAAMGTPGQFPTSLDGTYVTPELFGRLIGPFVIILTINYQIFQSINTRVINGLMKPNDFWALLNTNEFWTSIVSVAASICQIFGVPLLQDAGLQALLVNSITGLITVLVGSNAARPSGQVVMLRGPNSPLTYPPREVNVYRGDKIA